MAQRLDTLKDLQDWIDANLKQGTITPETELTLRIDGMPFSVQFEIDPTTKEVIVS